MHVSRLRALFCGALFILPMGVRAETLSALIEQAWQRAPAGRAIAARQAEAEATLAVSESWVAGQPVLGLSQRNGRAGDQGGMRESEVSMSAPIFTPGQRSARRSLAGLAAAEAQAQLRAVRLDIAGEVRTRLWDAAGAQALLEEKEGHLHHTEELADEIRRRVAGGELARVDALLADQEVQSARIAVQQAKTAAHTAMSRLRLLTGPAAALPLEPEPLPGKTDNLRVQAARATESRAQAALQLAQASRSAPPTLGLSMRRERDSMLAASERSLGVSLQVPLGSAGRNRPVEAQALTQIALAAAEARQAEDSAQAELDLARAQLEHARAALAAAGARVQSTREYQQLIEKAFKLGERGLADLLRSHALAHESQVAQRQQEVALGRAHAQLNQASGVLP